MTREDLNKEIYRLIKKEYGDAVAVRVFVNSEGIEIKPEYRGSIVGYSMQKINGEWVPKGDAQ